MSPIAPPTTTTTPPFPPPSGGHDCLTKDFRVSPPLSLSLHFPSIFFCVSSRKYAEDRLSFVACVQFLLILLTLATGAARVWRVVVVVAEDSKMSSAFYYTIVIAVVGESGSGKTALVNAYLRKQPPPQLATATAAANNAAAAAAAAAAAPADPSTSPTAAEGGSCGDSSGSSSNRNAAPPATEAEGAAAAAAAATTGNGASGGRSGAEESDEEKTDSDGVEGEEEEDAHVATDSVGVIPSAMQMEDLVHNRLLLYDTPGDDGRRSLALGVVDGRVSSSHGVVVVYDTRDRPPHRSLQTAEWWLQTLTALGLDLKLCLVGAHANKRRGVPEGAAEAVAQRYGVGHLTLSDVGTQHQAHRIFASVCEEVYLKLRTEDTVLQRANEAPPEDLQAAAAAEEAAAAEAAAEAAAAAALQRARVLPAPQYHHPPSHKQEVLAARGDADFVFRVCVCGGASQEGEGGVGCSSVLDSFASHMQMRESIATEYATSIVVRMAGAAAVTETVHLKLHASRWVTASEVENRSIAFVVACYCDRASLHHALACLAALPKSVAESAALVRTKADKGWPCGGGLEEAEARAAAAEAGVPHAEVSAALHSGVDALFLSVTTFIRGRSEEYRKKVERTHAASALRLEKHKESLRWSYLPASAMNPRDYNDAALREMFNELDADGSGCIERAELGGLRRMLGIFRLDDFDRILDATQRQAGRQPGSAVTYDEFAILLLQATRL